MQPSAAPRTSSTPPAQGSTHSKVMAIMKMENTCREGMLLPWVSF